MAITMKFTHTRPDTTVAWHHETTDPVMSAILKQVEDYINTNYPGVNTVTYNLSSDGLTLVTLSQWSDSNAYSAFSVTPLCTQYLTTVIDYYTSKGGNRTVEMVP